jgi:hypothetical protein
VEAAPAFVRALREADLLKDLNEGLLAAFMERLPKGDPDVRRVELLRLYYLEANDGDRERRQAADRFVMHDVDKPQSAAALIERIATCTPEIAPLSLERIGTDDGPLVIRSKDDAFSAVNESEEDLDTDEIDLSELDASPTVAVRAIFRAVNILLDRQSIRERYVLVCADGSRECYAALSLADALKLCAAGHLEDHDDEAVLDLGAWGRS